MLPRYNWGNQMAFTNEYSVYPNDLDGYSTLPLRRNLIDEIRAEDHNRLRDAIVKIEQELGVKPAGVYASVADRLDMIGDAMTAISAHMADATDAHDASAVSVLDTNEYFYNTNVEGALNELSQLLPDKPSCIGDKIEVIPNTGIPSFVDGYGTKSLFNITNDSGNTWSLEATDNEIKRTQMRRINGIRGIHVFEVSAATPGGLGLLTYDQSNTTLSWRAPADLLFGDAVDVSGLAEGEWETIKSYNILKALRFARTSDTLPIGPREEHLEVLAFDAVPGYFSIPGGGMKFTKNITRAAT